jgi:hypothetical protein
LENLKHAPFLHDHSGHADDIEASERIKIDSLDVLIDEANVGSGSNRRDEARLRDHGRFDVAGIERQRVIKAPIRWLELWIDQTNFQSLHEHVIVNRRRFASEK